MKKESAPTFYSKDRWQNWLTRIGEENLDPESEDFARLYFNLQNDTTIAIAKIITAAEDGHLDEEEALDKLEFINDIVLAEPEFDAENKLLLLDSVQTSLIPVFYAAEEYLIGGAVEEQPLADNISDAVAAAAYKDEDTSLAYLVHAGTQIIDGTEFGGSDIEELDSWLVSEWLNGLDSLQDAFDDPEVNNFATTADQRDSEIATGEPYKDSDTESAANATIETVSSNGGQAKERAIDARTRGEQAEANGRYQQAIDAYEEAISNFEQAITAVDVDAKKQLQDKFTETRTLLEAVTATRDKRDSVATTLQTAERNFKEAIARYAADSQTVARIRFRQARDAFEEAQQTIAKSDKELLAQPIEIDSEQEATLSSMAIEDFDLLDESTIETLSAVDIESVSELEANKDGITPAVVTDLQQTNEINAKEATLLTLLSWWHANDIYEFSSEEWISHRKEQADYGFNHFT